MFGTDHTVIQDLLQPSAGEQVTDDSNLNTDSINDENEETNDNNSDAEENEEDSRVITLVACSLTDA